eukprot:GFYU01002447.1.p1 GENE.GFYU01002447.1~~GFYU01002447.1.p1  ORF type:complete len:206 (+),score=79.52 GFYU01002447.1:169-786(+)
MLAVTMSTSGLPEPDDTATFTDIVDEIDEDIMDTEDDDFTECLMSSAHGQNADDDKFDEIVGTLEDIMMNDEFLETQEKFMKDHCDQFENTDENKLIYMDIFKQYTTTIEQLLEDKLIEALPEFKMEDFIMMVQDREDQISGDMFDMLLSFGDFNTFKEIILSYKEGANSNNPSLGIHVRPLELHTDEQEDGEAMPDLNLGISPL